MTDVRVADNGERVCECGHSACNEPWCDYGCEVCGFVCGVKQVVAFHIMPCDSVEKYDEDGLLYCKAHVRLVCGSCQRHVVEDENSADPGSSLNCSVHGFVARVGHP